MRIARILLITFLFFLPGPFCLAQDEIPDSLISVSFTNKQFEDCLIELSNQSGLYMAYKTALIDTIFVRSFHSGEMPLKELLDTLLNTYGLDYKYRNQQIFLKKPPDKQFLKGIILSASDSLAIPYASISLFGTPKGTISDFKGVYEWELSSRYMNDTALISSLGFEREKICLRDLKSSMTEPIYLDLAPLEIEAVEVHQKIYQIKNLGNKANRANGSIYIDTHGQQTGLLIRNEKAQPGWLNSVSYYLSAEGNTNAPYRIRIYAIDSLSGLPTYDLINEIIVAKPQVGEGWHSTDLSRHHIEVSETGLFVALEGIFPNDYVYYSGDDEFIDIRDKNINTPIVEEQPTSISYGQRLGYNRKEAENTWHYSLSHTWFQLRKQQYGVMIRAAVRFEKAKKKRKGRRHE